VGRRRLAIAAAVVSAIAVQASTGLARAEDVSGFTTSVSCSPNGVHHSQPTHVCQQGDMIRAVLRYGSEPLEYRLCIRHGKGATLCGLRQESAPGAASVVYVPSRNFAGLVTVSWRVGTTDLGRYPMRFVEDPVVPPFGISPLIVSGTHRLFGLIVRHIPAGLRVRAWRVCNRECQLPLRLVHRKGETRRYRVGGSRRLSSFSFGDQLFVLVDVPGPQPSGSELWGRLYRGAFVRDRSRGRNDTAIRRLDPPLCNPPGLPFGFSKDCREVRSPQAPLYPLG
jgi:hypothetical protein